MWLKRRGLFNFRDHDSSKYGKESEIDCQCPRQWTGLVTPRILQEVETFIAKFPMAEVLTCPEDKLSKCPTEILEEIFQYNRLEVLFWSTRRCVMLERDQSSGTSPWWGCSPWTMEWASWEVSGKWKALKPIGLRSEKSLELMTAMSSGSSLREVSLQDCVLHRSGWAKNAVCGIFNPCEGGPLKFQSWRTSGGCSVLLDGLRVHSLGHWQSISDSLPYLLESWPWVC